MGPNREELRDSDVHSGRYSEDYGCSFIGVIASLIVILGLFIILGSNSSNVVITPGELIPVTEIEMHIGEQLVVVVPLAILAAIIYWLYSRRNRSALETV